MALQADLLRVVQQLSFCRDMAGVMAVLRQSARELSGADGVTIVLRDGELCHYVEENAIGPLWKGRRFPLESCISGWCMLHRGQVAIPDIYADARVPHEAYQPTFVNSLAMTPIRREDPIGAIGAYWGARHVATPEELEVLQALGDSAAMAIANSQLIERLQEANRRKDEFLAMLAHELRNPLAPLRNALQVLRLQSRGGAATRRARAARHDGPPGAAPGPAGGRPARRARGSAAARSLLRRERLDLVGLVRPAPRTAARCWKAAGLALDVDAAGDARLGLGDPDAAGAGARQPAGQRRQVHRPPAAGSTVRLAADRSGQAVVTVRDTGIGIEPGGAARALRAFAQARPQPRTAAGAGWASGLALVKGLVELHGGEVAGGQRGAGAGGGLHPPAAAAGRSRRRWPKARGRAAAGQHAGCGSWSSRTTATRPRACAAAGALRATRSRWPTRGRTGWSGRAACGRTWSCATSACPEHGRLRRGPGPAAPTRRPPPSA